MIKYFEEKDKEIPGLQWEIYGDTETNEIVVIAVLENERHEKRGKSPVLYPTMIDRIFGTDLADLDLAYRLSDEIFDEKLRSIKLEKSIKSKLTVMED